MDKAVPRYTVQLQPHTLSLDLNGKRVALSNLQGRYSLTPDHLDLYGCSATLGKGTLEVNGRLKFGDDPEVDLTAAVHRGNLDPTLCSLLPEKFAQIVELIAPSTTCEINDAHVFFRPNAKDGRRLELAGQVSLADGGAQIGLPLTEINGKMDFHITQAAGAALPTLGARIDLRRIAVSGRVAGPISCQVMSDPRSAERLLIRNMAGRFMAGRSWGRET